jgi:hypothetical protein
VKRHHVGQGRRFVQGQFAEAKAEQARLEQEMSAAEGVLKTFPRGAMGLTPDHVRATPEWQAAKARSSKAFKALQDFNTDFVSTFAKELRAERDERRARGRLLP